MATVFGSFPRWDIRLLARCDLVDWTPLSPSQEYKLDRIFDEKVDYLVGHGKHLEARLSGPLKHLHKYRNEAYHRADVRSETIRTAAMILLEINCQMMLTIPPGARSFSSSEDYSWIEKRFQIKASRMDMDLRSIADQIRSTLLPNDADLARTLAAHLSDRLGGLYDSLDFIVENAELKDRETALTESERYADAQRTQALERKPAGSPFHARYSLNSIRELEARLSEVSNASTRVDAFDRFATIERDLEPIEGCVNELALAIDAEIQLQVDIARGK